MGKDIHVRVIIRDIKTDKWEEVKLYRPTKKTDKEAYRPVDFYPFRNSELFDILTGREDDYFPTTACYHEHLPSPLKEEIEDTIKNNEGFDFNDVNLADIKLYLMKHPKVRDYDYNSKNDEDFELNGWKDNPVKYFVELIERALDLYEPYWDWGSYSNVRIIYWFDW